MGLRLVVGSAFALLAGLPVASAAAPPSRAGSRVVIVGGSAAQRQLARLTALRVGGTTIRRVAFRQPSAVLRHEGVRGGSELVVSSDGNRSLRAGWEQRLYLGVYLGLMARWPRAAVDAAATDQSERPAGRLSVYDVFGSNPKGVRVAEQTRLLWEEAARRDAHVVELRVAATPARAITMTVRVSDPAAFLKHRARPLLALLERPRIPLLGYYLGVQDGRGRPVWGTFRLPGEGGLFVIPRLDACSPVSHSEPAGYQPPPCPAH